jgi:hypothetical protein
MAQETAFPYPIVRVPGRDALAAWERLRSEGRGWPLVLGGEEDYQRHLENLEFMQEGGFDRSTVLATASTLRFPEDMRQRRAADLARLRESLLQTNPGLAEELEELDDEYEAPRGEWEASGSAGLSVAEEFVFEQSQTSTRPYDEVIIALMPTDNGADAVGLLGFGGWNDCPFPPEHVAAFRRWHAQYGADVVGVSGDVINARVSRRPATREAALALAQEQCEYCTDIVHQGVGTLDALAATLMAEEWWYFWWD